MSAVQSYPSERALVDEIEAVLVAHGWTVRREVHFRVYADLRDRQKGRVDVLAYPPKTSPIRDHLPCIAIEAKNYASLEEVRVAKRQAIAAMHGFDFQYGEGAYSRKGKPTQRPGIALIATATSWATGRAVFSDGDASGLAVIERDLWEHGCAILKGPPSDPSFQSNSGGVAGSKRFRLFGSQQ